MIRFWCSPQSSSDVRQATSPWRHQEELVGSSPRPSTFPGCASTFWDGGQNFLFNFFCFTELAADSTFQPVLCEEQRNAKTSRSHTVMYFYMQNHHEPTPRSNVCCMGNQQDDRVKTSPRSSTFFIGFKSLKIPKMNKRRTPIKNIVHRFLYTTIYLFLVKTIITQWGRRKNKKNIWLCIKTSVCVLYGGADLIHFWCF